jgi:putative transposase
MRRSRAGDSWRKALYDKGLGYETVRSTVVKINLSTCLEGLPASALPRVVVLDNGSLHVSKAVKARRRGLAGRGIYLYYLPPYSPELNRIEPVFRQVKYQEIPVRSYTSKPALREAVENGFNSYGKELGRKSGKQLRPAA